MEIINSKGDSKLTIEEKNIPYGKNSDYLGVYTQI